MNHQDNSPSNNPTQATGGPQQSDVTINQLRRQLSDAHARNTKLAEVLQRSRAELAEVHSKMLELLAPPSTYGVVMDYAGGSTCEVFTSNRQMRLTVTAEVEAAHHDGTQPLGGGDLVRIADGAVVIEHCGQLTHGETARVAEILPATPLLADAPRAATSVPTSVADAYVPDVCVPTTAFRIAVQDSQGGMHMLLPGRALQERLAGEEAAHPEQSTDDRGLGANSASERGACTNSTGELGVGDLSVGDLVLIDRKAGVVLEKVPTTDVAELALEEVPTTSYDDIGGLDDQIHIIRDSVELPFLEPELFAQFNLTPPRGLLLYGPPGCGKTLIAKAVAHSLASRLDGNGKSYFLNVKGPELLNKFVGETERIIRQIFARARELSASGNPVVVFFDEMESIFRTRGSGISSDTETTIVPQLLTELDGVEAASRVIVIGATNREDLIDPALLRPGRLDIKVRVNRPDKAAARDILRRHLGTGIPLAAPMDELITATVDALWADVPVAELIVAGSVASGSSSRSAALSGSHTASGSTTGGASGCSTGAVEETATVTVFHQDFVSGAMLANIVDRAKQLAVKDIINARDQGLFSAAGSAAGSADGDHPKAELGVGVPHLLAAVAAERAEHVALPEGVDSATWMNLHLRHIPRLAGLTIIGQRSIDPIQG